MESWAARAGLRAQPLFSFQSFSFLVFFSYLPIHLDHRAAKKKRIKTGCNCGKGVAARSAEASPAARNDQDDKTGHQ
jgi:hypothetical protein